MFERRFGYFMDISTVYGNANELECPQAPGIAKTVTKKDHTLSVREL